jgi:hypothetical protein
VGASFTIPTVLSVVGKFNEWLEERKYQIFPEPAKM